MSWRTVVITKRAKMDLRMNHMVVRSNDSTTKIHLGEVQMVMIETTQVSITSALLATLSEMKIPVIFCDTEHNPISELLPFYGCHDCSKKVLDQIKWNKKFQDKLWKEIVKEKILNQKKLLKKINANNYFIKFLETYYNEVEDGDPTNREGLAAKVYFAGLFGPEFIRGSGDLINAALNYGYQILLSSINMEIKISGYLTELGIHHKSQHNFFNLGSDLIEPLRPIVDEIVYTQIAEETEFTTEHKRMLQDMLNSYVKINDRQETLNNAIKIYVNSIFKSLEKEDLKEIKWREV